MNLCALGPRIFWTSEQVTSCMSEIVQSTIRCPICWWSNNLQHTHTHTHRNKQPDTPIQRLTHLILACTYFLIFWFVLKFRTNNCERVLIRQADRPSQNPQKLAQIQTYNTHPYPKAEREKTHKCSHTSPTTLFFLYPTTQRHTHIKKFTDTHTYSPPTKSIIPQYRVQE